MARGKGKAQKNSTSNGATVGFEAKLWAAADALRTHAA